jgi:3-hydroxyisobutyrate dehydrogenase-like beta-hydroxyacid dehydrogenase
MIDNSKIRVGFVGLGKMGTPMCKHIGAAGFDVKQAVKRRRRLASILWALWLKLPLALMSL